MELECIMLSEISQSEKEKYHMILETKQMNIWEGGKRREGNKQSETLNDREQTVG